MGVDFYWEKNIRKGIAGLCGEVFCRFLVLVLSSL